MTRTEQIKAFLLDSSRVTLTDAGRALVDRLARRGAQPWKFRGSEGFVVPDVWKAVEPSTAETIQPVRTRPAETLAPGVRFRINDDRWATVLEVRRNAAGQFGGATPGQLRVTFEVEDRETGLPIEKRTAEYAPGTSLREVEDGQVLVKHPNCGRAIPLSAWWSHGCTGGPLPAACAKHGPIEGGICEACAEERAAERRRQEEAARRTLAERERLAEGRTARRGARKGPTGKRVGAERERVLREMDGWPRK